MGTAIQYYSLLTVKTEMKARIYISNYIQENKNKLLTAQNRECMYCTRLTALFQVHVSGHMCVYCIYSTQKSRKFTLKNPPYEGYLIL